MEIDGEEYLFYKDPADQRRHHPRNDGRSRRQRDDGEGGADPWAGDRDGGAQLWRHRHRQVERIAERGTLNPRQVKIPGAGRLCVVVVAEVPRRRPSPSSTAAAFAGEIKGPMSASPPCR